MERSILLILTAFAALIPCGHEGGEREQGLPAYSGKKIQMAVDTNIFTVSLFDNATAAEFGDMLPLTIRMEDVNGNEKFCRLQQELPGAALNPEMVRNGDLMAYGGNGLVLFYKTFTTSYNYARIGTVDDPSGLHKALGTGTVTVTFHKISHIESYTLTYNTNGATSGSTPAPVTRESGSAIILNNGAGFGRTGYSFAGWNILPDGSGGDYPANSRYTLTSDTTLYANWNAVSNNHRIRIANGKGTFTVTLTDN